MKTSAIPQSLHGTDQPGEIANSQPATASCVLMWSMAQECVSRPEVPGGGEI
jgi:hypothetical protein